MEKEFMNKRQGELYAKFANKRLEYISSFGSSDDKALRHFEGLQIYQKLDKKNIPLYCKIIENIDTNHIIDKKPVDDPVYNSLIELQGKVEKIVTEQYDFNNEVYSACGEDFSVVISNKEERVNTLIDFFEKRGLRKTKCITCCWEDEARITEDTYNYFLKSFVNVSEQAKEQNMAKFIEGLGSYNWDSFGW